MSDQDTADNKGTTPIIRQIVTVVILIAVVMLSGGMIAYLWNSWHSGAAASERVQAQATDQQQVTDYPQGTDQTSEQARAAVVELLARIANLETRLASLEARATTSANPAPGLRVIDTVSLETRLRDVEYNQRSLKNKQQALESEQASLRMRVGY
ncbi:MAG TPA: hypothetical protein VGI60_02670 [Chthoniobacterales bacterium]|jgi:flagellar basal body-associated protein FliL